MSTRCFVMGRFVLVALLAVASIAAVRAADDFVKDDEPTPLPARPGEFGGRGPAGGRMIIMPGLRLQIGGQGQVQVHGDRIQLEQVGEAGGGVERREPYLGVVAGPVAPAVRAQLDLPEGVGVSIDAVAAGSPAEKAGVRPYDVIHRFNNQVVCSAEQLSTLVKVVGAGTTVPLTLVRGGHEKVVEAVLEERAVVDAGNGAAFVQAIPDGIDLEQVIPPGVAGGLGPQIQGDVERRMAEALARAGAGGAMLQGFAPGMVPGVQGNLRAQVLTIGPNAQSATVVSDARGTVEIRSADGKKTVTVKDPSGKEVHSGPLDSDEDMDKVPEDYRDWVREIDGGEPAIQPFAPEGNEAEPESGPDSAEAAGPTT